MYVCYFSSNENDVQKKTACRFWNRFENDVVSIFHNTFMSAPASIEGRSQRYLHAQTNKAVVTLLEQSDILERMLFTHYFLQSVCRFMISQITVSGRMMIRNKCSKLIFLLLRISSILIRSLDRNSYLWGNKHKHFVNHVHCFLPWLALAFCN